MREMEMIGDHGGEDGRRKASEIVRWEGFSFVVESEDASLSVSGNANCSAEYNIYTYNNNKYNIWVLVN